MAKIEMYTSNFCPYCVRAKMLLDKKGLNFEEHNVEREPDRYREMLTRSNGARTVPQIFINDRLVEGGCDGLYALERKGELDSWLG